MVGGEVCGWWILENGGFLISSPMDPWDGRYMYLHEWLMFMEHVDKYTILGSSGYWKFLNVCFQNNISFKYCNQEAREKHQLVTILYSI